MKIPSNAIIAKSNSTATANIPYLLCVSVEEQEKRQQSYLLCRSCVCMRAFMPSCLHALRHVNTFMSVERAYSQGTGFFFREEQDVTATPAESNGKSEKTKS